MAQHGGCDVIKGTKWVANLWLTLVGEPGTEEAFKGWIDYGKDENKFQPGTNWKGETLKTGAEGEQEIKEKQEENKERESDTQDDKTMEGKEKLIEEAKEKSGDGSYDVKLEL